LVLAIGDALLFLTTALVLSVTCLCVLLHVRARDAYTRRLLAVLVPLCVQMGTMVTVTYVTRVFPDVAAGADGYAAFTLWVTFVSVFATAAILFSMSRYLVDLLPAAASKKALGRVIISIVVGAFAVLSLFFILNESGGDWGYAMAVTVRYHFFAGSMFMTFLGVASLVYRKRAESWEKESLLTGMIVAFVPLPAVLPIDLLFFRDHPFKIAYLSFSVFVVFLYFFISRQYFHDYGRSKELSLPGKLARSAGISPREAEIARLLAAGKTNREIGETLCISNNTVKTHVKNIYAKLGVRNRVQLFSVCREEAPRRD